MSMANKPKPKTTFGKPEKKNTLQTILMWGFVAAGVIGIIWMIAVNPRQKNLTCSSSTSSSMLAFGTCTEE